MTNTIEITIAPKNEEIADMLVAELSQAGFDGFEEKENTIIAFASESNYEEELTKEILLKYGVDYSIKTIASQNWNQSWEANFDPVIINDFVGIRADFHPHTPNVKYELVITPKMSFGTGHHATTFLMIEQMGAIEFEGKKVLDFGTGTGVLAILAEKLGAAKIIAIDNDEWSIRNVRENFEKNQCKRVELHLANSLENIEEPIDIILANINRNVILATLPELISHSHSQTVILLSGLLNTDEEIIRDAVANYSLKLCSRTCKENWICLKFINNKGADAN